MATLLKLNCLGDEAVSRVKDVLNENGLQVLVSFNSHRVRDAAATVCPHHGTSNCDCQIVILLVYDEDSEPATLLIHGQDGETWISLAASPGHRPPAGLENKISQALNPFPQ